ncbi:hypothetical protein HGM15179_006033 [Zosterops borbonicus]|uniref:Uncharacterized protein n=1 Tax=Zosterops borbonicus TaxID=364589 RepID=A0A8K1GN73_9PASS|nr:hypothetical protein HGM15179_006033 [Zosterops borbonicus]
MNKLPGVAAVVITSGPTRGEHISRCSLFQYSSLGTAMTVKCKPTGKGFGAKYCNDMEPDGDLHLPSQALDPAGTWPPKAALLETVQSLEDAVTSDVEGAKAGEGESAMKKRVVRLDLAIVDDSWTGEEKAGSKQHFPQEQRGQTLQDSEAQWTVGRTRNYGPKLQYKRDLGFMFRYPGGVAPEEAAGESLEGQVLVDAFPELDEGVSDHKGEQHVWLELAGLELGHSIFLCISI